MSEKKLEIQRTKLVLVEGEDDKELFRALLDHLGKNDVRVAQVGGKTKFKSILGALANDRRFPDLTALLLVRDADRHPNEEVRETAFETARASIETALRAIGLDPPTKVGVFEERGAKLRLATFIFPDASSEGELEDLLVRALASDVAWPCTAAYFSCLDRLDESYARPRKRSKALVQAFLASRAETDARIGVAAKRGDIPFDHAAFDALRSLLNEL